MAGLLFSLLLMQPIIKSESGRTRTGRRGEKAAGRGGRPRVPLPSPPPGRGAPGGSDGGAAGPGRFT